jgi:hypothetical protein
MFAQEGWVSRSVYGIKMWHLWNKLGGMFDNFLMGRRFLVD